MEFHNTDLTHQVERLSIDHRTTVAAERERIRECGGVVLGGRVNGIIEVGWK
jgi:hypothetical protein